MKEFDTLILKLNEWEARLRVGEFDLEKLLQVNKRTLQDYRDTGMIGFIQISGKILYRQSDVLKLLEDNYRPASKRLLIKASVFVDNFNGIFSNSITSLLFRIIIT